MKHLSFSKLLVLLAVLFAANQNRSIGQTVTNYGTPGNYSFTVSAGITSLYVDAMGGRGGNTYSNGGYGGRVVCTLTVVPGQTVYVNVGGAGGDGNYSTAGSGGFNGGGNSNSTYGAGGGGSSDVMLNTFDPSDRVVVAGGGGGAGYRCSGGEWGGQGGGSQGTTGASCYSTYYGGYTGYGGTQYGGGSGGSYGGAAYGSFFYGGDGSNYGGGGGGGWYGGGGGYYGGGGGGSNYYDPSITADVQNYQGYNSGDGYVSITEICTAGNVSGSNGVCVGSTITLTPEVTGGTWTGSNDAVATVDYNSGDVTGQSAGDVTMTYTQNLACGTVYTTFDMYVDDVPTSITATSGNYDVCKTQYSYFSSTGSGNWTISDNSIADIDFNSGDVYGNNAGVATLTYQIANSCYITQDITVLNTEYITGPSAVCEGLSINLAQATGGGTWSSSNNSQATIIPSTGELTGVTAGYPTISYTQTNGCVMSTGIVVNPLPAPFTGSSSVCQGLSITLGESSTGGTWTSSNNSEATVASITSTSSAVTGVAGPSTPKITYTLPTSCIMTKVITVNPLPAAIAGANNLCVTDPINPAITLSDATGAGSWTISGGSASIDASGVVTGLTAGAASATYTLPVTGCIATKLLTVNPLPAPISGKKEVCVLATTYLNDASLGGVWTSSNTNMATVGSTTGFLTGTLIGYSFTQYPTISYTLPTGCLAITTATVNPTPDPILGNANLCEGVTTVYHSGAGTGIWSSSDPASASVTPGPGVTGGYVTGVTAGNPTITYEIPATGCFSLYTTTVNPKVDPITPATSELCYGTSVTLNSASTGGTWSTTSTTIAAVSASGGVVTTLPASATGATANVSYTLSTGCVASTTITINPLPAVYNLASDLGATDYCSGGDGIGLSLNSSTSGVIYQLFNNSIPLPGASTGSGSALSFGKQTAAGAYNVVATDAKGCVSNMTGSPTININASPAVHDLEYVGGSNTYCDIAGAGIHLQLNGSETGINYTLNLNSLPVGSGIGVGGILDFGLYTDGPTYTAIAEDPLTHCKSNMNGVVSIIKGNLPDVHNVTVDNNGYYCAGSAGARIQLDFGNIGVDYELYNGGASPIATIPGASSSVDFGFRTVGNYTVVARNQTTNCTQNMTGTAIVRTTPLPALHDLTGGGKYCPGGTGVNLQLDGSNYGILYQMYNGAVATGALKHGNNNPIDFGNFTPTGNYKIVATDSITGCAVDMNNIGTVGIYPAIPVANLTVEGTGTYCAGSGGLHFYLSGSAPAVKYDLYNRGGIVAARVGTGSPLDFGLNIPDGVYNVIATDTNGIGCTVNMTGTPTVTINPLPALKNVTVTDGGFYCAGGTGVNIGLNYSDAGIRYRIYNGAALTGSYIDGASSSIDFGKFTATGTYTIKGTNIVSGCAATMTGSAVVSVNPTPVPYNMTGGGSYCAGGTGVAVGLFNSTPGINYQLYNGSTTVGTPVAGTGSAISMGTHINVGLYTIKAVNSATGCDATMTGSKVISIDPLPAAYNVTGGGDYCAGGAGKKIGLDNSLTGISYGVYNSTTGLVGTLAGINGRALDFGTMTTGGTYTIIATNVVSSCINNMNGSAVINITPLPAVDTVKGGGAYCSGDIGSDIFMSGSQPGVAYQLYNTSLPVGAAVSGTGARLDLGPQTVAGTYVAVATNVATGCAMPMAGTANVTINPLPAAYTVSGGGTMCANGPGFHINLSGSQSGTSYALYNNGLPTPVTMAGTGGGIDLGVQTAGGVYTIIGTNGTTGCTNTMKLNGNIIANPVPTPFAVSGGGEFCEGDPGAVVFMPGSETGINYQLYKGTTPVGTAVGGTGALVTFGAFTTSGTYTAKAVNMTTGCTGNMSSEAVIIAMKYVDPAVSISDSNVCVGDVVTFRAVPVNGGTTPSYEWKLGGTVVSIADNYVAIPALGDKLSVTMTGNAKCATAPTAYATVTVDVQPYVIPAASVLAGPSTSLCEATPVTFKATTENGGTAAGYSWLKNGVIVSTGSTTYTYTPNYTENDGDIITFMLRSDLRCRTADTVFSTPVVMDIDSAIMPALTISTHLGPVEVGQVDTFRVVVANVNPKWKLNYQWYIQNVPVAGANSSEFINKNVYNKDVVKCEVTKEGACGNQTAFIETSVLLTNVGVDKVPAAKSDVNVIPNPNKGEFVVKGTLGTANNEEVTLEVTNMLGQAVYSGKTLSNGGKVNERIKLSNTLANGMYLLNVRSESSSNVFHIVIEQ